MCLILSLFQVLVDGDDAFGGYGTEMLRYLSDDYGSKSVAVFPCMSANVSGGIITSRCLCFRVSL